ncbi:hypothetical protein C8Q74DRAFT_214604 [Fomes fomentarius]|nr:hypothetical protein C8Q74DRAFT_214604 [Fomes fomentarius]
MYVRSLHVAVILYSLSTVVVTPLLLPCTAITRAPRRCVVSPARLLSFVSVMISVLCSNRVCTRVNATCYRSTYLSINFEDHLPTVSINSTIDKMGAPMCDGVGCLRVWYHSGTTYHRRLGIRSWSFGPCSHGALSRCLLFSALRVIIPFCQRQSICMRPEWLLAQDIPTIPSISCIQGNQPHFIFRTLPSTSRNTVTFSLTTTTTGVKRPQSPFPSSQLKRHVLYSWLRGSAGCQTGVR